MANNGKFVTNNAGKKKEELAIQTSAGAADANKILRTDSKGEIDESFLPNSEIQTKTAFETLLAGDFIHFKSDGEMEKAVATNTAKPAQGFVRKGITAAASDKVYGEGILPGFTGLTIGADVYLSTTAGEVNQTAPSASGNIVQRLGVAWSATEVKIEFGDDLELI